MNSNATILLIDAPAEIILFKEAMKVFNQNDKILSASGFSAAFGLLNSTENQPDNILIGSGILLTEGVTDLIRIISDERYSNIPFVLLTEFPGEEKHLLDSRFKKVHCLPRNHNLDSFLELYDQILGLTGSKSVI